MGVLRSRVTELKRAIASRPDSTDNQPDAKKVIVTDRFHHASAQPHTAADASAREDLSSTPPRHKARQTDNVGSRQLNRTGDEAESASETRVTRRRRAGHSAFSSSSSSESSLERRTLPRGRGTPL